MYWNMYSLCLGCTPSSRRWRQQINTSSKVYYLYYLQKPFFFAMHMKCVGNMYQLIWYAILSKYVCVNNWQLRQFGFPNSLICEDLEILYTTGHTRNPRKRYPLYAFNVGHASMTGRKKHKEQYWIDRAAWPAPSLMMGCYIKPDRAKIWITENLND